MKTKLSFREYVSVASMLFGMFFGAGNLIFPIALGQHAGSNVWLAFVGLFITGVGMPLLGVAALGISRSTGLFDLSSKAGRPYGMFFTCLLYLTIGPFFAIPRCATTSFTVGLEQILPQNDWTWLYLLLFSALFFAVTLFFSLRPGKILTWIGKVLNPAFLLFLGILVIVALLHPGAAIAQVEPLDGYASQPFFTGFLEGYNTMDALASLAFGIVVVQVIKDLGVEDPGAVASSTVRSGIFSCLFMGVIYLAVTIVGVQSRGLFEPAANGGVALAQIARHYLGGAGLLVLAATVTLACLKTGGWPHHQLCRDLLRPLPQRPHLSHLGHHLQRSLLPVRQPGAERHHRLRHPRPHVPLPPGHRAHPAGSVRQVLPPRPRGLHQHHRPDLRGRPV